VEPLPRPPSRKRPIDDAHGQHPVAEPLVPYLDKIRYRGGGYAILMAFHGPPDRSSSELSKHEIVRIVEDRNLCDGPFERDFHAGVLYPGWKSIDTLLKHQYVARTQGGRTENMAGISDRFMLTAKGRDFIPMMLRKFSGQVPEPAAPIPSFDDEQEVDEDTALALALSMSEARRTTAVGSVGFDVTGNLLLASENKPRYKRSRDEDHLTSTFRNTKPNTDCGHRLSDSKNPELPPQEKLRQRYALGGPVNFQAMTLQELKTYLRKHGVPLAGITERAQLVEHARKTQESLQSPNEPPARQAENASLRRHTELIDDDEGDENGRSAQTQAPDNRSRSPHRRSRYVQRAARNAETVPIESDVGPSRVAAVRTVIDLRSSSLEASDVTVIDLRSSSS